MIVDLFQKTRECSRRIQRSDEPALSPASVVCKSCGGEWTAQQYGKNGYVCPGCGAHGRIRCRTRIRLTADKGSFVELFAELSTADPLGFPGYADKIAKLKDKSGLEDAVLTGTCTIGGMETCIGIMDSYFMMASMGSVVGEKADATV